MRIEAVDFFYAAMPEIALEADGSQDALLVRVAAGGKVGWGECEASPLTSIAAFVAPTSHAACQPVAASVIGQRLGGPEDIERISRAVDRNSMDLLQATHTYSGIEMALWDLLGQVREQPVWELLGYPREYGKTPYASLLFGDTPDETIARARQIEARGFRAVKFGWGPFGLGDAAADADQLHAAREGLGPDVALLVDAGQVWGDDVEAASQRIGALEEVGALWLEEPFDPHAYGAHARLSARTATVAIAGGEGSHNVHMAMNLIDYGRVAFVQIDTGRIGGIAAAKRVADYATARGVSYVNHTFTSHLALSASLQPYAGLADHRLCEYPASPRRLAVDLTRNHLEIEANGQLHAPSAPGLGIDIDFNRLQHYLRRVEISVDSQTLFLSGELEPDGRAELRGVTELTT